MEEVKRVSWGGKKAESDVEGVNGEERSSKWGVGRVRMMEKRGRRKRGSGRREKKGRERGGGERERWDERERVGRVA